jgi:fucose permease
VTGAAAPKPWTAVVLVYTASLLQGLAVVSFPASSAVLKSLQGLSDPEYGAIFLPQVVFAVLGSVGGGTLARMLGLKPLLVMALAVTVASQLLLAASGAVASGPAFLLVMLATGTGGLAFGLSGAPLNGLPPAFFPGRRDTAVVAIHTLLGLGLAIGPLVVAPFVAADRWIGFPLLLAGLNLIVVLGVLRVPLPRSAGPSPSTGTTPAPREKLPLAQGLFWLFALIIMLYAFAEATISNWAVIFLHEGRGVPEAAAGLAIAVFWGAVVLGRLVTSALLLRVSAEAIWLSLLAAMIAALLLLPFARGFVSGIGLFGLAGLACSAVFPLTITLVSRAYPRQVEWVSSMMIAALMLGVGLGSFAFGPLLEFLPFDQLYRLSALYPAAALVLAMVVVRRGPPIGETWKAGGSR